MRQRMREKRGRIKRQLLDFYTCLESLHDDSAYESGRFDAVGLGLDGLVLSWLEAHRDDAGGDFLRWQLDFHACIKAYENKLRKRLDKRLRFVYILCYRN